MVMITCNISVIATYNFARSLTEGIPNAYATTIELCRTLDLVTGSCCSPKKVIWKNVRHKIQAPFRQFLPLYFRIRAL